MSEEFESCTNCIHSADAESLCILRLCKHAIAETKECYESKAQTEYKPVTAEDFAKTMSENTLYGFLAWHGEALVLMERQGFVICKKTM